MRTIIILIVLVSTLGCTTKECREPYIKHGDECCIDEDHNNVCDIQESEKIVLVVKPPEPSCDDGIQNQGESGVDCGGPCEPCPPETCDDGIQNQNETGVDCGGPCEPCTAIPTCYDKIRNQGETGVDCGGPCKPCTPENCDDGIQNQGESGVDCGGPCNSCTEEPTCGDGIRNQNETGVDCGGPCEPCPPETCDDGIQNQGESGVDCGGPCEPCYCLESVINLTDSRQDGYVGDTSEHLDGIGDRLGYSGYNMVGDLDYGGNMSTDYQYRMVMAFPIMNLSGTVSDARVSVLPYMSRGTILDTFIEHIQCSGSIQKEDYSSQSDGVIGVIFKATDLGDVLYSIDVTDYLQSDIDSLNEYSCYRLYWNQTQLDVLNNTVSDRRFIYGYGSQYAPHLTYVTRPCIRCEKNSDCGETEYVTDYQCRDNRIILQYIRYRCAQPGTEQARCIVTQSVDVIDFCNEEETCINGENECFPKTCYDGEMNDSEKYTDCGGKCRPCHCFNSREDEGEVGKDCGGDCKPCPMDVRLPVVYIASPSSRGVYNSTKVFIRYRVNKDEVTCMFSLNDEINDTLTNYRYIQTRKGTNTLTIYCEDENGNIGFDRTTFTVQPKRSMVCPPDEVRAEYKTYFDKVVFFMDNTSQIGSSEGCRAAEFLQATILRDSADHYAGPHDLTDAMRDKLFGDYENAVLSYSCVSGVRHDAGYARFIKNIKPTNETRLNVVLYFRELENVASENSFWRVYWYEKDRDSVGNETYLDVPYMPLDSSCVSDLDILYQELDLTPLVSNITSSEADNIELRIAVYSRNMEASLRLMEAELSTE
jgi:hypothetical protein